MCPRSLSAYRQQPVPQHEQSQSTHRHVPVSQQPQHWQPSQAWQVAADGNPRAKAAQSRIADMGKLLGNVW